MNANTDTESRPNPLDSWRGRFGQEYIQRNQASPAATAEAAIVFRRILQTSRIGAEIESILEVGASIGINLIGLRQALGESVRIAAVEPNPSAIEQLRSNTTLNLEKVMRADAYEIPLPDQSYDLLLTNGVLIHVPPNRLPAAMREIVRVSRKYVMCSEYFSHLPVEIPYHGQQGLLWKRDFAQAYLECCPDLSVHDYGFLWQGEFPHFDNLHWWILKKSHTDRAGV